MERIKVVIEDLPPAIRGFTVYSSDEGEDFYTMFINARMSIEAQKKTYSHEIAHIDNHDFSSMRNIQELEEVRHGNF